MSTSARTRRGEAAGIVHSRSATGDDGVTAHALSLSSAALTQRPRLLTTIPAGPPVKRVALRATATGPGTVVWGDRDGSSNREDFTGAWEKKTPEADVEGKAFAAMVSGVVVAGDGQQSTCEILLGGLAGRGQRGALRSPNLNQRLVWMRISTGVAQTPGGR